MTTLNPFAQTIIHTTRSSAAQQGQTYRSADNRSNCLNLIARAGTIQYLTLCTSHPQEGAPTLIKIIQHLTRDGGAAVVETALGQAASNLRSSHVEPALLQAVCAKLGELNDATERHLAKHQAHQALLDLLQIAEEELAGYIVGAPPYRYRLVDPEYPDDTKLFVYIDVGGDMDEIIEAYERISLRKFPTRERFESLHVSMIFTG